MNWVIQYLFIVAAGSVPSLGRTVAISTETLAEHLHCPKTATPCGDEMESYCHGNGICCRESNPEHLFCVCKEGCGGLFCQKNCSSLHTNGFEVAQVMVSLGSMLRVLLVYECPSVSSSCEHQIHSHYCSNGIGCKASNGSYFCVCHKCFAGDRCHKEIPNCRNSGFEGTQVMVAFESILGVLIVCGLVAAVFLLIKYYKNRINQRQDDQEIKKLMLSIPEFGDEDEAFARLMIIPPRQHLWKQNVKLIIHDSSKMKGSPCSNSVPGHLLY